MSNQTETSPDDLRLHISDLDDIPASITLDKSEHIESVWYEFWDSVLNYWVRRSSDRTTRLSVAPQRQIIREIFSDDIDAESNADWSFQADPGDTSMELSGDPPSIHQRIHDARDSIGTESRIPDFTAFALRRDSLPHRRLICIIEIKPRKPIPRSELQGATPQIITQAKFAFDTFPDLRHVISILALGDTWCLFRFSRDDATQMYLKNVEGWKDDDTFDPTRTTARPRSIINKFIIIPFSKVLKDDGSDYSSAFQRAIRLITSDLKAGADTLIQVRTKMLRLIFSELSCPLSGLRGHWLCGFG